MATKKKKKDGFHTFLPLNLIIDWNNSQNSGKHLLMFTNLLTVMIKDKDERPGEQMPKARFGSTGSSVLVELRYSIMVHGHIHQPGSSPNSILPEFYGGFLMSA